MRFKRMIAALLSAAIYMTAGAAAAELPQDLTAEQSLLGAMLVDPNCIPEVIEQVRADDFYAEEMCIRDSATAVRLT